MELAHRLMASPPALRAAAACLTALAVTWLSTPLIRVVAVRYGWIGRPVEDRWGRRVVARLGGVAIYAGFLVASLAWLPGDAALRGLLVGATLVFLLGLVDDLRRMQPYSKLLGQLLIGTLVVASGVRISLIDLPWISVPLSVLWFVLIMNAFNLLDNMDGLAAGTGAIAAAFCAVHAATEGQWTVVTASLILMGACAGFLRHNFPPAKIYMGDSGSHLLGLALAALALMGSWQYSTRLLSLLAIPTLVLALPIFDTCFVTIQRLLHQQHPFVGGADHISHRLAVLGLSTRQTVMALYVVSTVLGTLSLITAQLKPLPTLALWLFVLVGLVLFGRYLSQVQVYRLQPAEADSPVGAAAVTRIETSLFHKRRLLEVLVDFCLVSSVHVFAYLLRFEGVMTHDLQDLMLKSLPIILSIKLGCFAAYGLYRGMWRYIGLQDILTTFKAVTLGSLLSAVVLLYVWRFEGFSRAVMIIDWMLTFLVVGGARVGERLLDEWIRTASTRGAPVVILGAGEMGQRVLRYLQRETQEPRRVVGVLDDDIRTHGLRMHGCEVLGGFERLPEVLDRWRVREVLVAIPDPSGHLLEQVRACCEARGIVWCLASAELRTA